MRRTLLTLTVLATGLLVACSPGVDGAVEGSDVEQAIERIDQTMQEVGDQIDTDEVADRVTTAWDEVSSSFDEVARIVREEGADAAADRPELDELERSIEDLAARIEADTTMDESLRSALDALGDEIARFIAEVRTGA